MPFVAHDSHMHAITYCLYVYGIMAFSVHIERFVFRWCNDGYIRTINTAQYWENQIFLEILAKSYFFQLHLGNKYIRLRKSMVYRLHWIYILKQMTAISHDMTQLLFEKFQSLKIEESLPVE